MGVTIDDLRPKDFEIEVKGLSLKAKPPTLAHMLILSNISSVFQDPTQYTSKQLKQTEQDLNEVIADVVPELKGVQLDYEIVLQLIEKLMNQVQPDDNKELEDKGVKIDTDPKAEKIG